MRNNSISKTCGLVIWLSAFAFASCQSTSEKEVYNVIMIMTDDQGYGDIGAHGNLILETPALDKLHDESIRFTDFHVNPFCAPTRAALMTGRHADLTHVRSTIYGRNHLNLDETTMAEYFKESGYTTGHFGKWHLGHNYPYRPIDRGFDQWVGHGDGGIGTSSDYWGNDKMNDSYIRNGKWEKFEGFSTDIYFNETKKFIKENKEQPFFVYLATNVPHKPWNVKKEWREKYEKKFAENNIMDRGEIDFFTTISKFDENLGHLRQFLAAEGLDKNTVIIFLTDNGTSGGARIFNAGMRGQKGSPYEGGHRVPCYWYIPGNSSYASRSIDQFTANIDILPTLIELCDLKKPEKAKLELSGRSLLELMTDNEKDWQDRVHVMHQQNTLQQYTKWKTSVVATEQWRLVNKDELYDLDHDSEQQKNVAAMFPEVVSELQSAYEEFWQEIKEGQSPYARPIIGSGKIKETWLTCDGWIPEHPKPHTWDQKHVSKAVINDGFWPIRVTQERTYRIEVRRWPKEKDFPISGTPAAQEIPDIELNGFPVLVPKGSPINVRTVRLKVGDELFEKEIGEEDSFAAFEIAMEVGETQVQAWFLDDSGNEYPGYYVYISE